MSKTVIIYSLFTLLIGLGLGFSIGRSENPFKVGPAAMMDEASMITDLGMYDEQFDLRFIESMIEHHEGAINMAHQALAHSKRDQVRELAQKVIEAQTPEIELLENMKKDYYDDR